MILDRTLLALLGIIVAVTAVFATAYLAFAAPWQTEIETPGGLTAACSFSDPDYSPDTDGDSVCDIADNCPSFPNADQQSPSWPTPEGDLDCDGWTSDDEAAIGTDPDLACGVAAWPPDFNDNGTVDIFDVSVMKAAFFSSAPDPEYDPRVDVSPDGSINVFDVTRIRDFFFATCSLPAQ